MRSSLTAMAPTETEIEHTGYAGAYLQDKRVRGVKSDESKHITELPTIDFLGIFSPNIEDRKAVAEEVREACHDIGFFYAVNHGIDPKYEQASFEQAKHSSPCA